MTPLREAAISLLPDVRGIFLRCDRGNSLYVTNVPARTEQQIGWMAAGFYQKTDERLTFLTPDTEWIGRFEEWLRPQVREKRLSEALSRASLGEILEEDMKLFIEGVKRIEMKGEAREYEKLVRQRAAVCLRERKGGGALACCALIADYLNERGRTDET